MPPDVQAPIAVTAARAGKHLLLEKPLATTEAGADDLVDAVTQSRVASVVFFTFRFQAELAANIRAGRTGHPCDVRFGRDVGRVIIEAQRRIGQRRIGQRRSAGEAGRTTRIGSIYCATVAR